MSCFEDFSEIQQVSPSKSNVFLGRLKDSGKEIIIKKIPIFQTQPLLDAFVREAKFSQLMSEYQIGPKIFGYRLCDEKNNQVNENPTWGLILMENLDGTIEELWPQLSSELQKQVTNIINSKISQMHSLGIIHRDTNMSNIMYTKRNNVLNIYLIDYGRSIQIANIPTDPGYLYWQQFNPGKTMEDYLNLDFELWQLMLKDI